jgi:hypothetical protein
MLWTCYEAQARMALERCVGVWTEVLGEGCCGVVLAGGALFNTNSFYSMMGIYCLVTM